MRYIRYLLYKDICDMKKVIVCLLLALSNFSLLSSQVIKIENGLSISSMNSTKFNLLNDNLYTYAVLLGCDYLEHRYFYLSSGIGYIQKGGVDNVIQLDENAHPLNTISMKGKWDYLHLNTSLRIKYPFKKNHLYIGAGLKADVRTSSTDSNHSYLHEGYKMASIIPGMKIEMGFNREMKRLIIGVNASYLIDFKDAGKSILLIDGARNNLSASNALLSFTLGYRL